MTLQHVYGIPYIPASSIKGMTRNWVISQVFASENFTPEQKQNYPLFNAEFRAITESKLFCALFGCPGESKRLKFRPDGSLFDPSKKESYNTPEKSALGQESQGEVLFLDAFPSVPPIVKADIMNPHYPDWYKEKDYKAPTDTQSPNPIPFLTVSNENNLSFDMYLLAAKCKAIDIDKGCSLFMPVRSGLTPDVSTLSDVAAFWLKDALTHHGIGAKTAVGLWFYG
jgi:CRISPR-associated protein Cmr6